MTRYLPPKGTALTARSAVRTLRASPPPPASTSPTMRRTPLSRVRGWKQGSARRLGTRRGASQAERAGARGGRGGRPTYQENDAETRCVRSRFVSSGNCLSFEAKKRCSWAA